MNLNPEQLPTYKALFPVLRTQTTSNGANAPYPGTFVPSANLAELVGKVGDATFAVGERFSGSSPASGKLYLSLNDVPGEFSDNSGVMNVRISYSPR